MGEVRVVSFMGKKGLLGGREGILGISLEKETYCEEEIADIVCDVDRQAHVGEMEAIAQPDQGERHDMMSD